MITGTLWGLGGAVRTREIISDLEVVDTERVLQRTGIAKAAWSHTEANVLSKNARCDTHREWSDIRTDWQLTRSHTPDVGRIIEQPLPIEGDLAEVELAVAAHARTSGSDDVRTPRRVAHLSALERIYGNAAIDNWDEIRVSQGVQHRPWPRTVNTREDQIMIQRKAESFRLTNGPVRDLDTELVRSSRSRRFTVGNVNLGPPQAGVAA